MKTLFLQPIEGSRVYCKNFRLVNRSGLKETFHRFSARREAEFRTVKIGSCYGAYV
jgi:hypothetical protein